MSWQEPGGNPPPGGTGARRGRQPTDLASRSWTQHCRGSGGGRAGGAHAVPSLRRRRHRSAAGRAPRTAYRRSPSPGDRPGSAPGYRPGPHRGCAGRRRPVRARLRVPSRARRVWICGGGAEFVAWFMDVCSWGSLGGGSRRSPSAMSLAACDYWRRWAGTCPGGIPAARSATLTAHPGRPVSRRRLRRPDRPRLLRPPVVERSPRHARDAAAGAAGGERGRWPDAGPGPALRRWFAMGSWLDVVAALPVVGWLIALGPGTWCSSPPRRAMRAARASTTGSPARRSSRRRPLEQRRGGRLYRDPRAGVVLPIVSLVALVFLGGQVSEILSTVGESI